MKIYFLLIAACITSCAENHNSVSTKASHAKPEFKKEFKQTDHLFLNYYFGMSVEEYEAATKINFQQKKILLADDRVDCKLRRFTEKISANDIENINRLSQVYYVFGDGIEEFEAAIQPLFKNNQLVRIELRTLQCFTIGDINHEFYRQKVNEIHKTLLHLHKEKHGAYITSGKNHSEQEIAAYKEAGIALELFNESKFVFNDNGKIITIQQKCCDFKPSIIYAVDDSRLDEILNSDFASH